MKAKTPEERKATRQAWYAANREAVKARVRARVLAKHAEVLAYQREWWQKNRASNLAKKTAHRLANHDAIRESQRAWYVANTDKVKGWSKKYRASNRDYYLQYLKKYGAVYRAANPEKWKAKNKAWADANPEKLAEAQSRRKAQKLKTQVEKIDFKKILLAANGRCGICRKPFDLFGIDFDHIIPLAKGGTHMTDNIQATHSHCNRAKGAKVG